MPNIYQVLAYHGVRRPHETALLDETRTLSYIQLGELSRNVAGFLNSAGVRKGQRVAILADNSIEYVALIYATALLGFILVPLNTRYSVEEIDYALFDSDPSIFLYEPRFSEVVANVKFAQNLGSAAIKMEPQKWPLQHTPFSHQCGRFGTVADNDACMIMYTSGTTSRPKGAVLTHGNFVWNAINNVIELELTSRNRAIMVAPLFHINAFGVLNSAILYVGGAVYVLPKFDAENYVRVLATFKPTNVPLLSVMWVDLIKVLNTMQERFDFVLGLQSAASPLSKSQQDEIFSYFPNGEWGWGFGQTESCVTTIRSKFTSESISHPGTTGHFWRHIEWRLVDENEVVIEGLPASGELQVRGPTIFSGYWKNEEKTSETLTVDGWLRTGDLLQVDRDEYAYFIGRNKDMIKTGGENVAALEVERHLIEHEAVQEAGAFGLPHSRWGEELVAAVVLRSGQRATPEDLRAFVRQRATSFKVPKRIFIVDQLPHSASGKVKKFALREYFMSRSEEI